MIKHKPENLEKLMAGYYEELDPRCRAILLELDEWLEWKFNKGIVITQIGRTLEENKAIGGFEFSAHIIREDEYVRAVDFRSRIYTEEEKIAIVNHLEKTWNRHVKFIHIVATTHGTGPHIHVNIRWMYRIAR